MDKKIPALTRGEEEIMQIIWQLGNGLVCDVIALTPTPHPKYTTVATFLKLLENKGYIYHIPEGKRLRYYPVISKSDYARGVMSTVLTSYFDGSLAQMVSFFSQHEDIPVSEMEQILEIMQGVKK